MTRDAGRRRSEPGSPGGRAQGADTGSGGKPPVLEQLFDRDSLYALREAVGAHAAQAGLPEGRVGDLVLAVHELAVNAVWHGAGHGRLRVWKTEDSLRCEVSDDGTASAARPGAAGSGPGDTPAWTIEPDHGLWMVRQLVDQASLRSGPAGTVAVVSLTLGRPGPPPFRLAQHARDGCTVLSVTGQLDLGSAGQLCSAVDELAAAAPALRLILDLSGLSGWDSVGLATLITVQERVDAGPQARMVVAGLPGHLLQRLRDAGLDRGFTWASTGAEAVGMLGRRP
jgi:anti-anti-sigma factor